MNFSVGNLLLLPALLLSWTFALAVGGDVHVLTPCSNIQNAGDFTNATAIVEQLALLDNERVMQFVSDAEAAGVSSFSLYQCTYEYGDEPVVVATAICEGASVTECVVLATYGDSQCKGATLCPDILNSRPAFTVDCSGVESDFPSCALACSSNTSQVSGMESCASVSPPSGPPAGSGGSNGNSPPATSPTSHGVAIDSASLVGSAAIGILGALLVL
jgi:hypothetical protein